MAEQKPENKRAESLRELAQLMTKPDVINFLSRSMEMGAASRAAGEGGVIAAEACGTCCWLFGGGRTRAAIE